MAENQISLPPNFGTLAARKAALEAYLAEQTKVTGNVYGAVTMSEKVYHKAMSKDGGNIDFNLTQNIPNNGDVSLTADEVFVPMQVMIELVAIPVVDGTARYSNAVPRTHPDKSLFKGLASKQLQAVYGATALWTFSGNQILPKIPMTQFLLVPSAAAANFDGREGRMTDTALPAIVKTIETVFSVKFPNKELMVPFTTDIEGDNDETTGKPANIYALRLRVLGATIVVQDPAQSLAIANAYNSHPSLRFIKPC